MCTVKKDLNIPESSPLSVVDPSKLLAPCLTDYDQMNRKQSQLLLDMIYSSANKKKCVEASLVANNKKPCPLQSFLNPATLTCVQNKQVDSDVMEELNRIKGTIEELQRSIAKLPQQIIGAVLENQHCCAVRSQLDSLVTEDDFDKLSVVSEEDKDDDCTMSSRRSMSTCSSDIEVLNYCPARIRRSPGTGTSNTTSTTSSLASNVVVPDISKEISQLAKALNSIVIPPQTTTTSVPFTTPINTGANQNLFSYWEQRYHTSKNEMDRKPSTPPIGNIRCRPQEAQAAPKLQPFPSFDIPKILPYNSNIDLNVWLK